MVAESLEHPGRVDDVTEEHGRENALPEFLRRQPEGVGAGELDRLPPLVADDEDLVSGRNFIRVARPDDEFRAVVHGHLERARHRVADVSVLAGARAHDRRDVLRPAPARLQGIPTDRDFVEENDVDASAREAPDLIGGSEAFALQARHGDPVLRALIRRQMPNADQ